MAKIYRVWVKRSQGSKWEFDREYPTLKEAQSRRRSFGGYAYDTDVRTGQAKHAGSSSIGSEFNPTVYDSAGKSLGKFSRKAAKIVARAVGGSVGKPAKNPQRKKAAKSSRKKNAQVFVFNSRPAAEKYAAAHANPHVRISIRKARKVR